MATIFGTNRGCFGTYNVDATDKASVYLAFGGEDSSGLGAQGIWCTGIQLLVKENLAILPCFNSQAYLYAFGHDAVQSNFSVSYLCASYASDGTSGNQIATLLDKYNTNRASQATVPCQLSVHGAVIAVGSIMQGSVSTANIELDLQTVTFALSLLELTPNKPSGSGSSSSAAAAGGNQLAGSAGGNGFVSTGDLVGGGSLISGSRTSSTGRNYLGGGLHT